jgi:alpha-galactosidase
LWHGVFTAPAGEKRSLHVALRVEGERVAGETETPTRRASLVEGKIVGDGFSAIAESDWDGKLARRPIEGQISGSVMKVRVQAWPGGPMADYELRRISDATEIPRERAAPPPKERVLPSNGLVKTPPMGWNTWNKLGCRIDDKTIREMADALVSTGMRDAGYVYLNIDDCWQGERDSEGNIQSDPKRFPDMKGLADYVHSKGLKIGIYSSPGPKTCAGYEGSYGHEEQDARRYAAWGMDYLKYDWCSAGKLYSPDQMRAVFQKMGAALQATRRPIVYSICQYGLADVWTWGTKAGGNLWRTTGDIGANWDSVSEIGFKQVQYSRFAGPGGWNDPDMLEVGNGNFTMDEARAHMSMWAMLAAPLLAGNDLRSMSRETRDVLLNAEVIAVNQDRLGRQAVKAMEMGSTTLWTKPMSDGSTVIGVYNRDGATADVRFEWDQVGFKRAPRRVRDLWRASDLPRDSARNASFTIGGHGVMLLRVWK